MICLLLVVHAEINLDQLKKNHVDQLTSSKDLQKWWFWIQMQWTIDFKRIFGNESEVKKIPWNRKKWIENVRIFCDWYIGLDKNYRIFEEYEKCEGIYRYKLE